jgi:WD40 repeat protein
VEDGVLLLAWEALIVHPSSCCIGCATLQVTWHPTKPTLLASSSLDGSVVAFQTDGSKVKVLQHSSATSGCAWAREGYLLATTSEAGTVYV